MSAFDLKTGFIFVLVLVVSVNPMLLEGHGHIYYGNILYTDYETCRRVYFCNVPGCAHNNPDCTSFVKFSTDARLFTDYSETHLYFMSTGLQDSNISVYLLSRSDCRRNNCLYAVRDRKD